MHMLKPISMIFLALYLIFVGLTGVGVHLPVVTPAVVSVFALVAGVLFLVGVVKCWGSCESCEKK
jgi:hypothetical protein